jgi:hypothetical protein
VNSEIERILEGENNGFISGGLLSRNLLGRPKANYEIPQDGCCHVRDANLSLNGMQPELPPKLKLCLYAP